MRPDRLIVGEIRLPKEAFYTLQALHTGHDGSATTIHASSAEDALFRLELPARQSMRDLTIVDLRNYIARVFDLVVVLRRLRSGRRIVRQLQRSTASPPTAAIASSTCSGPKPRRDQRRSGSCVTMRGGRRRRLLARLEIEGERWS